MVVGTRLSEEAAYRLRPKEIAWRVPWEALRNMVQDLWTVRRGETLPTLWLLGGQRIKPRPRELFFLREKKLSLFTHHQGNTCA